MKNIITGSGLILNANSAIYHLYLTPGQLADIVITVDAPDQVNEVSAYFDSIEYEARHHNFITYTGYVGKKRVSVISTGAGNTDILVNELDALANIDFHTGAAKDLVRPLYIIKLSTSVSLQPDIPADSFIVSDFAIGLDAVLSFYQYANNAEELELLKKFEEHTKWERKGPAPYIGTSSRRLSNHFQTGYHHGITVSCPGFYGPQGRALRARIANAHLAGALASFHHNIRIVNMDTETAALYALGKLLGHHCLSVSVIANNQPRREISPDINKSFGKMTCEVLAVIEKI